MRRIFAVLERFVLSIAGWFVYRFSRHPSLNLYSEHILAPGDAQATGLRVTFLGVSTLLFDDGETAILTDGFFTRPGKLRTLFTRIKPDSDLIARYIKRAGIKNLAAIIVVHSHYDHALDAPVVARQTGALLIGSESTANIGRSSGLSVKDIRVIQGGEEMSFGRFQIKLLRSLHSPLTFLSSFHIHRVLLDGQIKSPLELPARWSDYKEGGSYSVLIEHDGQTMLVQGSAGFREGALHGHQADVVFLGIGTLGKLDEKYRDDYWREVVQAVTPKRIIPIHWDDFSISLDRPLVPMSRLYDDFDKSMEFLLGHGGQEKVDVRILPAWIKVDPFAGL